MIGARKTRPNARQTVVNKKQTNQSNEDDDNTKHTHTKMKTSNDFFVYQLLCRGLVSPMKQVVRDG